MAHGRTAAARSDSRLSACGSPYLRQHAGNPVDWWPWSEAAIEEARRRDVPIFLSIGYSTCYWCHVMARESFEDPATAAIMNASFVNVKVDREERPDVDEIYMTACQAFTRLTEGRPSGGWPLSAFLEPRSLKPFFVGTYFPPTPAFGRASFTQVLAALADAWANRRGEVVGQSTHLGDLVAEELESRSMESVALDAAILERAADALRSFEDREHGGFGGAPKFPQPVYLRLLEAASVARPALASAVDRALEAMALGGLFDHVGGGFHRYAVDATWTVPHFEKMLYDNGQLAKALATSLRRRPEPFLARTLRRTLEWMLREMRVEGGFAAALDAETQAREGLSYLWTPEEVRATLDEAGLHDLVDWAFETYGLASEANFRDPHHPDEPPAWVLRLQESPAKLADRGGCSLADVLDRQERVETALRMARDRREQPARDDKVLAGWNGLAIGGLARGGEALGEAGTGFIDAAVAIADEVLLRHLVEDGTRLLRTPSGIAGQLEDHALLAEGLLDLVAVLETRRPDEARRMLEAAARLSEVAATRFGDPAGGWFDTEAGQSDLFVRAKRIDDGAVPSGAGTMILVELELAERTSRRDHLDRAVAAIARSAAAIAGNPVGAALGTIAAARLAQVAPDRLPSEPGGSPVPVRASLHPAVPAFGPRGDATATLRLEIDPPHHINAHDPGAPDLVGLEIASSSEGFEVEARYPAGELYREQLRVHARRVEIPLALRRAPGAPAVCRISVRAQACTDRHCLPPILLEVPVP